MDALHVFVLLVAVGQAVDAKRPHVIALPSRALNGSPSLATSSPGGSDKNMATQSPAPQSVPIFASSLGPMIQEDIAPPKPLEESNRFQPGTSMNGSQFPFAGNSEPLGDLPADFEGSLPGWSSGDTFGRLNFPPVFPSVSIAPMPMFSMNGSLNDSMSPFQSEFAFLPQQASSSVWAQPGFSGPMGPWSNGPLLGNPDMMAQMPMGPAPPRPFMRPPPQHGASKEDKVTFAILRQILKGGHVKVKLETKTSLVFEQSSESAEHNKYHGGSKPHSKGPVMTMPAFLQQNQSGPIPLSAAFPQVAPATQPLDDAPVGKNSAQPNGAQSSSGALSAVVPKHLQSPGIANDIG